MRFIADLQLHSKYSRATSKDMVPGNMALWAQMKGIQVLGTGDFTHPAWIKELKEKLEPAEPGLYRLKAAHAPKPENGITFDRDRMRFLVTGEISNIYSKNGKVRRVHNLIWLPSLEVAEGINTKLSWIGNLKSDGRPILGLDSEELAKIVLGVSAEAMVVPAHCLLPDALIHTKEGFLKKIQEVQEGELVFTHQGGWRSVERVIQRPYRGSVLQIRPYYFRSGLTTTPEHPFFAIKTHKNCHSSKGICKPHHKNNPNCKHKYYEQYRPAWIQATALERGDVLVFPRFLGAYGNHAAINVRELAPTEATFASAGYVWGGGTRSIRIPKRIPLTKEFCRLIGYFLAEGYVNGRDAIAFTFHASEERYLSEVVAFMRMIFGLGAPKRRTFPGNGVEITFYSRIIQELFANLCYASKRHGAAAKAMPSWMLGLAPELQVEILRGWWRGDKGYTSSRILMNQMKVVLLRLGIIPSIYEDTIGGHRARGHHRFEGREIEARATSYAMIRLAFFEDRYRLLQEPEFAHFRIRSAVRHGWIDDSYIYLPIRDIEPKKYSGTVYNLEVAEDNSYVCEFATVHNCWTPWFSVFGSMSGFDSLDECYGAFSKYIYAVETGLSSDPPMNWRLSQLDRVALTSNSDSHSLQRLGREANIFEGEAIDYFKITEAFKSASPIKLADGSYDRTPFKLKETIEFYPEEGKYHYDGHRLCKIRFSPQESKEHQNVCPKCGKSLTIGVMNRVEAIADRPLGAKPEKTIPYRSLVSLDEVIAEALGQGKATKKVFAEYFNLIRQLGSEFSVLLDASRDDIERASSADIAEGVMRVREGKLQIAPGFDGEYGTIKIFEEAERGTFSKQASLF